ncbi:MAG TPA: class I SAM-dependent RNA methyltransferase [Mesorhizobium sp.]|nr:class I SAM-dependent RNA methyltransferase [Mesorhizobium sp.]
MSERLHITRLGSAGDGVADSADGPVYVPFALPGEDVEVFRAGSRAQLASVLTASPERQDPVCRHFGTCGGCALQHLETEAYRAWKRDRLVDALRREGIEADVQPLVACPPRSRRRVAFSARRTAQGAVLGFNRAQSHEIVDISENWIAVPAIVEALPALRDLAARIAKTPEPFRLLVTATQSGLDIAAEGSGRLGEGERRAVADSVVRSGWARLAIDGEIVIEPRKPVVTFGQAAVAPPPGAFLQAVAEAEEAMAAFVSGHFKGAKRVLDLFAGVGSFALRLASGAAVHAVESDAAALAALDRAARGTPGLKPVTVENRDLHRRSLLPRELEGFDAAVFDPPRAGAEAQARDLARSNVPRVAAVSCNPTTLARDLKLLLSGGYRLLSVTPVDQFLWSPHVETVALLEKPKRRR